MVGRTGIPVSVGRADLAAIIFWACGWTEQFTAAHAHRRGDASPSTVVDL